MIIQTGISTDTNTLMRTLESVNEVSEIWDFFVVVSWVSSVLGGRSAMRVSMPVFPNSNANAVSHSGTEGTRTTI